MNLKSEHLNKYFPLFPNTTQQNKITLRCVATVTKICKNNKRTYFRTILQRTKKNQRN